MSGRRVRVWVAFVSLLVLPGVWLLASGASATAATGHSSSTSSGVSTTLLGSYAPTFVGPAATGCGKGCDLLSGPYPTAPTGSSAPPSSTSAAPTAPTRSLPDSAKVLPSPRPRRGGGQHLTPQAAANTIPTVSCQPLGSGCDTIASGLGGVGVKGLNAVDSAEQPGNVLNQDIEPPDQGLCAGNNSVVEANNIGEVQVFSPDLKQKSAVISLDTIMGLGKRNWSSGGDISCLYDQSNGGHWFFTEIVSASPESQGGPFAGCFAAAANSCYEGIAVTTGSSPYGPYNVYFMKADYDPSEPGYPYLLNDFAKIATSRDAFLIFYDEFPLNPSAAPGFGGGALNGAQEFAFDKNALEDGVSTTVNGGNPNPAFTVARENMGLLRTPDGTCASDNTYHEGGITCWFAQIPAEPPDASQFDNSNGGSAFMLGTLDYYGLGDNRLAAWHWSDLHALNSYGCSSCSNIRFAGQLFSNAAQYYGEGVLAAQKAGPTPLGDECGQAGLSSDSVCPENGIATNGDFLTQVSQANGQLWAGTNTEIVQTYSNPNDLHETHQGVVYWVVGTSPYDESSPLTLTKDGYVSPAHEDIEYPAMGAEGTSSQDGGNGLTVMGFTLSGNGGPTGADNGGYYPSTAFGALSSTSNGLLGSQIKVADLGQAPEDGFTEYLNYPGTTSPRWGDYSAAVFMPGSAQRVYFSTEYIQYPNCMPPAFTLTIGTCGGTRDGLANWGTSVNYATP